MPRRQRTMHGAVFLVCTLLAASRGKILIRAGKRPPVFEYSGDATQVPVVERTVLQFVSDFAVWAEWDQVVVFIPATSGSLISLATFVVTYFNRHGKFISVHSTSHPLLPRSLYHNKHRLGVAVFWDPDTDDFFDKVEELDLLTEYHSWLFILRESHQEGNLTLRASDLRLGIRSNAVVCKLGRQPGPTKKPSTVPVPSAAEPEEWRYFEKGDPVCVPENQDQVWYRDICVTGSGIPGRIKRSSEPDPEMTVALTQVYKVSRSSEKESLVEVHLGYWDAVNGLTNVDPMLPIEKRFPLNGTKIVIGVRNSTFESPAVGTGSFSLESDVDEEMHMNEVLGCLMHGLNASREMLQFPKLGWRNEEGGWTHMLGAVVAGTVDFALDTINVNIDLFQEMSLTYPIVRTMNNIYFKRPESGGMRDIFLASFSSDLLLSVFTTGVLLALAMISISVARYNLLESERKWEVSEAALWTVSVICMQGSTWRPNSKSGSLLLICSLLFALVIYNAYAAFITSVLSVKSARIKNLEDLLHSNFAFGYTLANTDELFLRTVNDSLLRELYFKGLKENDGVNDPIEGMHLAGKGNYAFFVAARTARRALRKVVAHGQRCGIQELILPITRTVAAIPMSPSSPYKRIINLRVLRMMESGILHRFQRLILPSMPKCVERTTFNSARLADVYSAFYMLFVAWAASATLLAAEVAWFRRRRLRRRGRQRVDDICTK